MSGILTPGYLRWDGTKYVLDHDVEIVGPSGSAGPTGPVGPAGPPGPSGVASGDLTGNYPGPIAVVGLTGILGVVSFGGSVTNPTITQTATGATIGQTMTLKAQNATSIGGDLVLQTGTGTTAGILQFMIGGTQAAYFDANKIFRLGPNANATISGPYGVNPISGTDYIYGNNAAGSIIQNLFSGSATQRAAVSVYNYASSGTGINGVSIMAPGSSFSIGSYQQQGVIEQSGPSTSALIFSKILGDGSSRFVTGRIFQSGAWTVGDLGTGSSSFSQAGLSGPLLQFGAAAGSLTTTGGQGLIYKTFGGGPDQGTLHLQGATGVDFISGTTSVANTISTKFITTVGRRVKVRVPSSFPDTMTASDHIVSLGTLVSPVTVNLPASPTTGDTYIIKDANGSAATNNITVSGNGVNIDGGFATITLMTNFTQAEFTYNGTTWISSLTNNLSPNTGYTSVVNVASGGSTTVVGFDQLILCDPTSTTCTVTAPLTPIPNMRFTVKDATFTANVTHFIAVSGNGKTLEDPASIGTYTSPVNLQTAGRSATWAYDPTRLRWTLVSSVP